MTKVFISGSITIKKIDLAAQERINRIVESGFLIILGDASGADRAVQNYIEHVNYRNVVVYCSGKKARNNCGSWDIHCISTSHRAGSREFYQAKDREMANDCDYGFMIWDGSSTGTLSNVIELTKRGKYSLVYANNTNEFIKIKCVEDVEKLKSLMSQSGIDKANKKIKFEDSLTQLRNSQSSLFG
ncbi:hypothetical protein BTJ40_11565 [Microbulbifer sp. A4B17]|uniref:hypothetical protein n=1 Tax=Microbulbifer sp. A4B17 TaxID=359370 RepID=UPI000D52A933|nr:hypothetical protein [Microbulbifer sp. A4B17]AWF81404.1 hypothetical protein BTJ40_11565 [Microbulbifer sp. A4B17]